MRVTATCPELGLDECKLAGLGLSRAILNVSGYSGRVVKPANFRRSYEIMMSLAGHHG